MKRWMNQVRRSLLITAATCPLMLAQNDGCFRLLQLAEELAAFNESFDSYDNGSDSNNNGSGKGHDSSTDPWDDDWSHGDDHDDFPLPPGYYEGF